MRRILCNSLAFLAFAVPAMAADLPARTAAPSPIMAAPVFTWTGLYVGGNLGVGFAGSGSALFEAGGLFPTPASNLAPGSRSGNAAFTGGLQAGYNWQVNQFVYGLETDINWRASSGRLNGTYPTNPAGYGAAYPSYTLSGFDRGRWYGTLRARIGVAFDRALIYATGGLAYGETNGGGTVVVNGVGGFPSVGFGSIGNRGWRAGWALGAGVEYALTNNWTIKGEYLHVDLGRTTTTFVGGGGGALVYRLRNTNADNIVRIGLNYKFGGYAAGPVFAKY